MPKSFSPELYLIIFDTIEFTQVSGLETAAICGVTVIFSFCQNGWSRGSGSLLNTSRVALDILPLLIEFKSSVSFIRLPLPALIIFSPFLKY